MAPGYQYWDITRVNFNHMVYANPCSYTRQQEQTKKIIPETKKQRIARIAKEKMFASWNVHHNKTMTIKEVVQICKPQHKINYSGKR